MWIQIWILLIDFCPRSLRIIIRLDDQFSLVAERGHPQLPHQVLVSQVPGGENTNQRVANNQRATNLYASTKFPCTRSPNSRFSASSWKKSGLRGTTFWLINLFICCKTYHVLVNCTIDWHAWNSCTITWRLDIFWTNSNNRKSELFLPKRKTNTAPGIDGFPQVDLTTALAAWKLSLTKRFPSWLILYHHRLTLFGMALDTMVTNWVAF